MAVISAGQEERNRSKDTNSSFLGAPKPLPAENAAVFLSCKSSCIVSVIIVSKVIITVNAVGLWTSVGALLTAR